MADFESFTGDREWARVTEPVTVDAFSDDDSEEDAVRDAVRVKESDLSMVTENVVLQLPTSDAVADDVTEATSVAEEVLEADRDSEYDSEELSWPLVLDVVNDTLLLQEAVSLQLLD